jgi:hypothetical protein
MPSEMLKFNGFGTRKGSACIILGGRGQALDPHEDPTRGLSILLFSSISIQDKLEPLNLFAFAEL